MPLNTAALARLLSSWFGRLAVGWRQWLGHRLGDRLAEKINAILRSIALPVTILMLGLALLSYSRYPVSRLAAAPSFFEQPSAEQLAAEQPDETRGVWITNVASDVLFAPWGIPRALEQLAELQFNTVYPVVWNRGKTFYRSSVLEKMTGQSIEPLIALTHPREDPLAEMVRIGHEKNFKVLPWFEYGFMIPLDSPLAQQHPDWLTSRQNGSRRLKDNVFEVNASESNASEVNASELAKRRENRGWLAQLLKSGAPQQLGWLNPMHPSVQGLLLSLVDEVVTRYNVDGVQFDDHFSLPVEFGYDDYTVALYKAEHQGQGPPSNPADEDWLRWRAGKLSKFMYILSAQVKASCPSCRVSLSPNPAKFAYRFHLQNWRMWVRKGWVDELIVQIYRDDIAQFERELDKDSLREAARQIPVSIGILTGTWRRPVAFEQIRQQVKSSRDRQFAGVSFFYWDTLWSYFTPEAPQRRREQFNQLMAVEG
ncbi:MAG: family 10 glycosylhydrolase [Cyanobacteria bacterium P01_D01_bin.105]